MFPFWCVHFFYTSNLYGILTSTITDIGATHSFVGRGLIGISTSSGGSLDLRSHNNRKALVTIRVDLNTQEITGN